MLCVVDDAHWLDPATAGALLFCARRLGRGPGRDGVRGPGRRLRRPFDPQGLAELVLTGLEPGRSPRPPRRATWATRRPRRSPSGSSPRRAATRWPCWSCRPSSTADQLRGSDAAAGAAPPHRPRRAGLPRPQPAAARRRCSRCCCSRPPTTPASSPCCAGQRPILGLDEQALEAAVDSGLLVDDATSCAVRHPLVRSAIYQAATGRGPAAGAPGAGRGPGRLRRPRPGGLAPRRRRRRARPGGGRRPRARRVPGRSDAAGYVAALRGLRTRGGAVDRPGPACRADLRRSPQRLGVRAGRPRAGPARRGARGRRPTRSCSATSRGCAGTSRSTSARRPRPTGSSSRPPTRSTPIDPVRALEIGVAAAVMRTYGADSGTPLPVGRRSSPRPPPATRPGRVCLQADAGRDDPGGRGRLGRRRRRRWTVALAHRRAGRRPRRALEPRQRRPPAGRRRRAAALLRATRCREPARPVP